MDFGPLDLESKHVHNSEPSIAKVKSDGGDLISHSASNRATCGCIRMLRRRSDDRNKGGGGRTSWECVHLSRAMWQHRDCPIILQRIGQSRYFAMNSIEINIPSS